MSLLKEGYRSMSGEAFPGTTPAEEKADQLSMAISDTALDVMAHTKAQDAPAEDRRSFETGLVETLWTTVDHCRDWKLARIGTEEGKILLTNTTGDMKRVRLDLIPKSLRQSFRWAVTDSVEMLARGLTSYEDLAKDRNKAIDRIKGGTPKDIFLGGTRSTAGSALLKAVQPDRRTEED